LPRQVFEKRPLGIQEINLLAHVNFDFLRKDLIGPHISGY
jgi:hypothetical protein